MKQKRYLLRGGFTALLVVTLLYLISSFPFPPGFFNPNSGNSFGALGIVIIIALPIFLVGAIIGGIYEKIKKSKLK